MSMHSTSSNATFQQNLAARHVQAGQPSSIAGKTIDRFEELLGASGVNLLYAGYPYDPSTLNAPSN